MTKFEKIVVSAYTGVLMCDFSDLHEYVEKILERPVFTHEFANQKVMDEIKEKSKNDFLKICNEENTPTANDKEAVHGEWAESHDLTNSLRCSVCGEKALKHFYSRKLQVPSNFCPHCGADMRGEKK